MSLNRLILISSLLIAGLAGVWYGPTHAQSVDTSYATKPFVVVDTGQENCYNEIGSEIVRPAPGESFYGQDAQHTGNMPGFTDNGDGTVTDNVTGLMWQQSPDTDGNRRIDAADKLTYDEAVARASTLNLVGYTDWRLPTIKELYSLIDFRGTDPSGYEGSDLSSLIPFMDTGHFDFAYGDTTAGERIIDAQYASDTLYVSNTANDGGRTLFGVNFADGRIKGYGLALFGSNKTFFVIYVRGNSGYGQNDFADNGDGTITDNATGLMWSQDDSAIGLNWEEALAWVEQKNAENYLGYSDWRLPDAKELQSIVDYTRSPDTTGSAAIDPLFDVASIVNEAGQVDFPSYWSSTTHVNWSAAPGPSGVYVAFGRAMGYMNSIWVDVHGAGAQRSDPKSGDPADYPFGRGPQGDAIRIYNYVRCVRSGSQILEIVPDIKANGSDGPLSISSGDVLSISISLDPGSSSGMEADWWVAAYAEELGWWTCVNPEGWYQGLYPYAQTALYHLSSTVVLSARLPSGRYTFYFAVDANADGEPNADWLDFVQVDITDP